MSSSKATEKSTGLCAACEKEGALLRCVPCRDVGIDIFFCNRDCQVKHGKTHKAVCGQASACDDSTPKNANYQKKRAKALRKVLKESHQSFRACQNCMKTEKEDIKLSFCSSCDSAAYCSRECQVAHWPKHKKMCKHNIVVKQKLMDCTLTASEKNIQNLFEQWSEQPVLKMGTLNTKCRQIMDISECPPTKIMVVSLEFDYNLKTFVFAEEPKVIPISKCSKELHDAMEISLNQGNEVNRFRVPFTQYAIVTCKALKNTYQNLCPMHFEESCLNALEESIETEKLTKRIPLNSNLFDGWDAISERNMKEQIDYLKKSPICTGFYHNVMHFFNNKARLSLRAIVIYVKMGKELGQITNFVKYEDMPKSEFKTIAKKVGKNSVIFENQSHVQQTVMTLIVYKNIETDAFLHLDSYICKLNKSGNKPVETYNRNADYCFKQLQDLVKKIPLELIEKVSL